jgi:hypothetical protein
MGVKPPQLGSEFVQLEGLSLCFTNQFVVTSQQYC